MGWNHQVGLEYFLVSVTFSGPQNQGNFTCVSHIKCCYLLCRSTQSEFFYMHFCHCHDFFRGNTKDCTADPKYVSSVARRRRQHLGRWSSSVGLKGKGVWSAKHLRPRRDVEHCLEPPWWWLNILDVKDRFRIWVHKHAVLNKIYWQQRNW